MRGFCVCVQSRVRKEGWAKRQKHESQESGVCENSRKHTFGKYCFLLVFVAMHFASRVVSYLTKSASTLLVDLWWYL